MYKVPEVPEDLILAHRRRNISSICDAPKNKFQEISHPCGHALPKRSHTVDPTSVVELLNSARM